MVRSGSRPLAGVRVTFDVVTGAGTVSPTTAITTPEGNASTTWRLGPTPGGQSVRATVAGLPPVTFTATADPGPPVRILPVSGNGQTGIVGRPLPDRLRAQVTDVAGNPLPGVHVTFRVVTGGGTVTDSAESTGPDGLATVEDWILGPVIGFQSLEAVADDVESGVFFAIGNPVPPATFVPVQREGQQTSVGTPVPALPVIEARDSAGTPQEGVPVQFTVRTGNGTVLGNGVTTDSAGRASPGAWILGLVPGLNSLAASTLGHPDVVFDAIGTPVTILPVSAGPFEGFRGNFLASRPEFEVRGVTGAAVPGLPITFTASGGGSVGGFQVTDSAGRAAPGAWRFGPVPGLQTLTAILVGASPATATGTAVSPPAGRFDIELQFVGQTLPTTSQRTIFMGAAARWTRLILGDLPEVTLLPGTGSGGCLASTSGPVDDLLVLVELGEIDGAGRVLASAGPCAIRDPDTPGSGRGLPVLGRVRVDTADIAALEASGRLEDVVTHEIGHALGIGTLWDLFGLLVDQGRADPFGRRLISFTGSRAVAAHWGLLALDATWTGPPLPVDPGHWQERSYERELMSPVLTINSALSAISVASLADLGYIVDDALADPFSFGTALRGGPSSGLRIEEGMLEGPIIALDRDGKVIRSIPRYPNR